MASDKLSPGRTPVSSPGIPAFARDELFPAAVAVVFGLMVWSGDLLKADMGNVPPIWFANGVLLGFMLADRQERWQFALLASFVANVIAKLAIGNGALHATVIAACNSLEAMLSFVALRHLIRGPSALLSLPLLLRFIGWAVIAAPLLISLVAAAFLAATNRSEFLFALQRRFAAHALGVVIVTPLIIGLVAPKDAVKPNVSRALIGVMPYVALLACTVGVFLQTTLPLLFLIFPPLVWVVFKHSYSGAAVGVAMVSIIALTATLAQSGPLMLTADTTIATRVLLLQLLLASCVVTAYPMCAMLTRQHTLLLAIAASEQQLRLVADNSRDVIIQTDPTGRRTYVSPSISTMFGYTQDEALGGSGSATIHKDDRAMFEREEAVLAAGAEGTVASYRVRHRDGHYVWVEVAAKTIRDSQGAVTGWISTTRDVSERKRVEEMKANFITTVSHELRTPLTAMTAAVGLAQSGKFGEVPSGLKRLLELAHSNGNRLSLLVNDILDFEKLSSGRMEFALNISNVDRLLSNAVTTNEPYAQRHNVRFVLGPSCGAELCVDEDRFQQIMSNLLSNAAKFSNEGDSVEIAAQIDGGACVVLVKDHGSGIPESFHSQLFERFSQADASDQRSRAGSGLGMAIAKDLTEAMGGSISFTTELGLGTTFFLTFPLARA